MFWIAGFKVIKTAELTNVDIRHASERTKLIVTDPPLQASVLVEGIMSHVCLSCDELTLAAVVTLDGIVQIYMYDVHGFATQVRKFLYYLVILYIYMENN